MSTYYRISVRICGLWYRKQSNGIPGKLELGYGYSSVTEKKRKEDEKYNTWNPETGLREKKYFCELEESFFEKEEWYLRLMLIGEDWLAHNLATRDRGTLHFIQWHF